MHSLSCYHTICWHTSRCWSETKRDSRIAVPDSINHPLGACALAGTTLPTNPLHTAKLLGFQGVCENSMDAVSDRDFCIEYAFCLSSIAMHMSRLCEEGIIWCNDEVKFIEISDAYCTGSSIMPQKRIPMCWS